MRVPLINAGSLPLRRGTGLSNPTSNMAAR